MAAVRKLRDECLYVTYLLLVIQSGIPAFRTLSTTAEFSPLQPIVSGHVQKHNRNASPSGLYTQSSWQWLTITIHSFSSQTLERVPYELVLPWGLGSHWAHASWSQSNGLEGCIWTPKYHGTIQREGLYFRQKTWGLDSKWKGAGEFSKLKKKKHPGGGQEQELAPENVGSTELRTLALELKQDRKSLADFEWGHAWCFSDV